ncbi:hypothetical protein BKA69DRAFT_1094558 [Paraphysoderma sedebokerense]|nr:hypothetical protein BKA69DRAFT_1094558 [Paraphysoderma sedebokerense]
MDLVSLLILPLYYIDGTSSCRPRENHQPKLCPVVSIWTAIHPQSSSIHLCLWRCGSCDSSSNSYRCIFRHI